MSLDFIPDTGKNVLAAVPKPAPTPEPKPVTTVNHGRTTPPSLNLHPMEEVDFDILDEQEWLAARGLKYESFDTPYFSGTVGYPSEEEESLIPFIHDMDDDGSIQTPSELLIENNYMFWLLAKLVDGITEWGTEVGGVPADLHRHYDEAWNYINAEDDDDDDYELVPDSANLK